MTLYVGTSGWQYAHWRRSFYPQKLAQGRWLEYFAERFQTAEVNNTFYHLPEASVFEQWEQRSPDDFTFALKMSRYLTHLKRLHDPAEPVQRFLERARKLGRKRGPTLIQLPPNFRADAGLLDAALEQFDAGERVAFEPRHESWFVPAIRSVLERRGVALCLADSKRRRTPMWRTADWGYVRFHHGLASPTSCYGRAALDAWVRRIAELWPEPADVFAYFNNDAHGCALRNAITFARLGERQGLHPTRVPRASEVTLTPG